MSINLCCASRGGEACVLPVWAHEVHHHRWEFEVGMHGWFTCVQMDYNRAAGRIKAIDWERGVGQLVFTVNDTYDGITREVWAEPYEIELVPTTLAAIERFLAS